VVGAAVAITLALITGALALADDGATSLWRHAYHVPVVVAALVYGGPGILVALAAVLLYAPFVIPALERSGASASVLEGLVTFAMLLGTGGLSAALAIGVRRQRRRFETLVAVQRALEGEVPLALALARLRSALASRLGADVGLAVHDGARLAVAGGVEVAPGSAVARVLESDAPLFVTDAGGATRPRRCYVMPIGASGSIVGALAIERQGDIGPDERGALLTLAAHLGLALENARLAARQRRFGDELAEKVAAATERVREIDRLKTEFVALASHELRTPLTALQGFSELLATRRFTPPEIGRIGLIMATETERLGRIVSDFLDLSRLERGQAPPLRRRRVDPGALVSDAVELLRRGRTTHALDVELDGPLPEVDADPDALDRVVKNLVGNAVKYSPAGTRVRVAARARSAPPAVEITIEDQGPGIAEVDLPRVFEPYYRAAGASAAAGGLGLGLAVVKSLIDAHGGEIHAENVAPHGTRMTLILPAVS
jgi:two-component system sensor histidine kinase KdpD